jgi:integrase
MSATHPIRSKKQIHEITNFYLKQGQLRNYLLIVTGLHTALRISDILRLTWNDVYDFNKCRIRESFSLRERKTGKITTVALNKKLKSAITLCLSAAKSGGFVFLSRKGGAISRIQAYRIIRTASERVMLTEHISCHSLRKTFGYHAWKGGVSSAVIMEIYNHSSFAVTKRYLGLTQDDKNECYNAVGYLLT